MLWVSKKRNNRDFFRFIFAICLAMIFSVQPALAMSSNNYQVIDSFVGNGGVVNGSSAH